MSVLTQASLVLTPNAVKASKLYSIIPSNGDGDMTVVRATTATRVNSSGSIESVAANVPRLNYDGSCPSVLVEPLRTNLVLNSEMFADAYWIKSNSATITANIDVSPAGTLTADRLTAGATLSQVQTTPTVVSGSVYTVSVWIKRITGTGQVYLRSIENVNTPITITNDWVRYSLTTTATSTVGRIGVALQTSGDVVSIWGAQLELGAYLTSYIPTVATSVTRNADVISKTEISDLIGQTQGVLFFEGAALFNDLTQRGISISDSTNLNRITIFYHSTSNNILVTNLSNNVTIFQLSYTITDTTQFAKIAIRYSNTLGASLWVNGVNRASTVNTTLPASFNRLGFDTVADRLFFGKLKQVHLYKTYLTDTEMANLTTL